MLSEKYKLELICTNVEYLYECQLFYEIFTIRHLRACNGPINSSHLVVESIASFVIYRSFSKKPNTSKNILLLDGPICGMWTEGLCTVFDGNETLFLASGERIHVNTNTKIVFEVDNMVDVRRYRVRNQYFAA